MNATISSLQTGQVCSNDGNGELLRGNSLLENNVSSHQDIVGCGCQGLFNITGSALEIQRNFFRLEEIAALLPYFEGRNEEDVGHFITILENTKRALALNCQTMKLLVTKQLKGNAKIWLHSRADFMLKTYEETLEDLRKTYGSVFNGFELRKRLEKIRWFGQEPFADYCRSKMLIAQ